jgi:hypothetical protein
MIREERLIPGAEYYSAMIPVRPTDKGALQIDRRMWFNNSYLFLGDSHLIFMDPDNGINYRLKADSKNSEKYVLPEEIEKYYLQGHDIVVYCHKGRRTPDSWGDAKIRMRRIIRDAQIIGVTSHRGTQRTYLFILHPDNYRKYVRILNEFEKTAWGGMFSREPVYGNVLTPEEEQRWG